MSFDPVLPWWALVLVVAVALAAAVWRWRRGAARADVVASTVLVALFAAMATDPATGGTAEVRTTAADVLFMVDTTGSMAAEDYDGESPRLDGVRADIMEVAEGFAGARYSMVTFDNGGQLDLPWTTDAGALAAAVDVLFTEHTMYSAGSSLDAGNEVAADQIRRSQESDDARVLYLVYISDGEQNSGRELGSFGSLGEPLAGSLVLGYGTPEGGPMLENWGYSSGVELNYIYDYRTNTDAISRIDEDNLRAIADQLGAEYLHRTSPGGLVEVAAELQADADTTSDGNREGARRWYWVIAVAAVAVAAWQLALTAGALVDGRRLLTARSRS